MIIYVYNHPIIFFLLLLRLYNKQLLIKVNYNNLYFITKNYWYLLLLII
jgi:hypothetical protein